MLIAKCSTAVINPNGTFWHVSCSFIAYIPYAVIWKICSIFHSTAWYRLFQLNVSSIHDNRLSAIKINSLQASEIKRDTWWHFACTNLGWQMIIITFIHLPSCMQFFCKRLKIQNLLCFCGIWFCFQTWFRLVKYSLWLTNGCFGGQKLATSSYLCTY